MECEGLLGELNSMSRPYLYLRELRELFFALRSEVLECFARRYACIRTYTSSWRGPY